MNRPALSTVIYSSSSETISQCWHWASVPERLQNLIIHPACHMTHVKIDHLWLQQCLASSSFPEKTAKCFTVKSGHILSTSSTIRTVNNAIFHVLNVTQLTHLTNVTVKITENLQLSMNLVYLKVLKDLLIRTFIYMYLIIYIYTFIYIK